MIKKFNFNKSVKINIFLAFFISSVVSSTLVSRKADIENLLSSGTSEIIDAMTSKGKGRFLGNVKKLNEYIVIVKALEAKAQKDPTKKIELLKQVSRHRKQISTLYDETANILENDLSDITLNQVNKSRLAKEMLAGLKASVVETQVLNSPVSELQLQAIGILTFGMSEFLNSMQPESKEELLSITREFNSLVSFTRNNPAHPSKRSNYLKISTMYTEMWNIIRSNLRIIQVNNPRMAPVARDIISALQGLALSTQKGMVNLSEFHPENIRYSNIASKE
jgi:hypothetical protein